jgi:uroporphyrin-III C-methyltransferase
VIGKVYLVGAGPGDPQLITVKGLWCLHHADVLLYDRLVAPELVEEVPAAAECIYVGKSPGRHPYSQAAINAILVERARCRNIVVRLKGGDPFVFGRGGEEAQALAGAGVPFEVVPGVTSALGVPARAGIPVTHRGVSATFAVLTGHQAGGRDDLNWEALAQIDTLVILMGVKRLPHVIAMLVAHGRDPQTPVAIVERGTLAGERVVSGDLGSIAGRAAAAGICSPATVVIGDVVRLRESLFSSPLAPSIPDRQPSTLPDLQSAIS